MGNKRGYGARFSIQYRAREQCREKSVHSSSIFHRVYQILGNEQKDQRVPRRDRDFRRKCRGENRLSGVLHLLRFYSYERNGVRNGGG